MSNLLPGENLILKSHQHWITVIKSVLVPIAASIIVLVADVTILSPNFSGCSTATGTCLYTPRLRTILTLVVLALALLWLIVVWIRWRAVAYTLTDQRIKIESGVFSRQEKVIPIDRVQDCMTKQSVVGRMLGYGRVEVDAAGAQGAEVLNHLPNPGTFRDQVFVQSERRRGGTGQGAPAQPNPGGV
jgi:uncharacterized membrane protein YdbT with pleckstrin-like domain